MIEKKHKTAIFQAQNVTSERLSIINFSLNVQECLAVFGISGSGKTSLLRVLADLEGCDGNILLHGKNRNVYHPAQWREKVMFVPAETAWWGENVAEHFFATCPNDWFDALGLPVAALDWPVNRLSVGERQRLGLLRALALKPDVLLLDEPTANLDAENSLRMEALIKNYLTQQQAVAIWVSHDEKQRQRIAHQSLEIFPKDTSCI